MNGKEMQDPDTPEYDAPRKDTHFAKVKHVNVAMLDSESIISPPVAPDAPPAREAREAREVGEARPIQHNPAPSRQPEPISKRPFIGKRAMLYAAGGFILFCAGIMAALFFNRQAPPIVSQQTTTEASDSPAQTQRSSTSAPVTETSEDSEIAARSDSTNIKNPAPIPVKNSTVARPGGDLQSAVTERPQPGSEPDGNAQAELNASLDNWISATNQRNVEQQMSYYAPKVNSFYRARNASINAVRDEKKRVFDGVDAVEIQAGKPNIIMSPDGRTATMRFRKKYSIKKGQQNRNGEVIQELKWVKSKNGWRIVSERDLKVVN